ncbi:hypothetical protein VCRA2113O326_130143 [Vibrio crassostreae]|nr:hypothetical protein VCRA2113O326_130143 [Vibrio crassostreae]CAK2560512.1 hypothetical protein VCRA2113O321_130146 [Vibrio crassostreae]CAK3344239.1 hypothetical protein VCRA2125O343_150002 [Vibrio crassostreae]
MKLKKKEFIANSFNAGVNLGKMEESWCNSLDRKTFSQG